MPKIIKSKIVKFSCKNVKGKDKDGVDFFGHHLIGTSKTQQMSLIGYLYGWALTLA